MSRTPLHVIFGAGAIGRTLALTLHNRGLAVRVVNRSGHAALPAEVEVVAGDAHDRRFAVAAATAADVVYQVLNPPYHRWAQEFPDLQANVLAAAETAGARLVSMENVYGYGDPHGRPMTEDTRYDAHTRKGAVRTRMAQDLMAAHQAGRLPVAIGRASDYFGPGGGRYSVNLGDQAMLAALTDRRVRVFGDPDQPHTYTYIPDIAAGLAALGTHPDAPGQVWHLPNDPHTRTTREILDLAYRLAGHRRARLGALSPAMLRVVGLFVPAARELGEMRYEFDGPFVVDSTRIAEKLGVTATPLETALAATLDGYR